MFHMVTVLWFKHVLTWTLTNHASDLWGCKVKSDVLRDLLVLSRFRTRYLWSTCSWRYILWMDTLYLIMMMSRKLMSNQMMTMQLLIQFSLWIIASSSHFYFILQIIFIINWKTYLNLRNVLREKLNLWLVIRILIKLVLLQYLFLKIRIIIHLYALLIHLWVRIRTFLFHSYSWKVLISKLVLCWISYLILELLT